MSIFNRYYKVEMKCNNCEFEGEIKIKKGVRTDKARCPNCGC